MCGGSGSREAFSKNGKEYCRSGTGKELRLSRLNVGNHLYIKNLGFAPGISVKYL